jgi:hypothetical protein
MSVKVGEQIFVSKIMFATFVTPKISGKVTQKK